jgi:hypothetical protein
MTSSPEGNVFGSATVLTGYTSNNGTLAQVLADIEAAAAKVAEARSAIIRGDREAAIHSCRRVEYNALNASLLIRSFSDQAFPAATEHLRAGGRAI